MKTLPYAICKITLAAFLLCAIPVLGQQQPAPAPKIESNPIANHLRSDVASSAKNMVAAAEEMPADKYLYQPTPQQMTFAHLIAHSVGTNYFICAKLAGVSRPDVKIADTDGKDKLVATLKDSYNFCATNLVSVDDSNLGEVLPFFGDRTLSRGAMMVALSAAYADHYSIASMYLRLNNLLPPTAKK